MFVPFNDMPEYARIWIYQSDRKFTADDEANLSKLLTSFCNEWTAHKQNLNASFAIKFGFFVILAVDEQVHNASGCSIDSSVNALKKIGENLAINFFKRENIAFKLNDEVELISLNSIKNYISSDKINKQSIFFNNLANTKADLSSRWMQKVENSWLSNQFK